MRAMKDSGVAWIGEIPEDWDVCKVKHYYDVVLGKMLQTNQRDESEELLPYMCSANVTWIGVDLSVQKKMWFSPAEKENYLLKYGDLLVAEGGDVAVSCLWQNELPVCCIQNAVHRVRSKKGANNRFLFYWMNTLKHHGYIDMICNKATLTHFTKEKLDNCILLAVPSEEQARIAYYLDAKCAEIDALIASKEKTNTLLKERRQSIIYEAVTRGLDPTVPMKDSGVEWIGDIPEGWKVAPLKYFASIRSGFTLGKKYDSKQEICEYPYLRVANVQGEYMDLENVTTIQMPAAEAEQYKLKAGELLMTEGGDRDKLGRGSIWRDEIPDCLHQNHVFALSTDECLNIEYLDYLTASDVGRNYFDYTAVKTTNLASTNATTILNFKIPIPSIEEQRDIVAYLKQKCLDIDMIVQKNDDTIQKLKEYRQSLVYEAVTGKIEV